MLSKQTVIEKKLWGNHQGKDVFLFRLQNDSGAYVEITNYGATLVSINVPDRNGVLENVVLGFSLLEGYLKDTCYIGSTIGRFANRIGGATFVLDEHVYCLDKNDGNNNNHAGENGFNTKVFAAQVQEQGLVLTYESPAGEGGFPGKLIFQVIYSWSGSNELNIQYNARSDVRTVCNFTNHAYFNLSAADETITDHRLKIASSQILQANDEFIPTGHIVRAKDLSFNGDLLADKIGVEPCKGMNTFYIFDPVASNAPVCSLHHEPSGRMLNIFTSYPGLQFYTGDYLRSEMLANSGRMLKPFDGLCLECQYYPDSPNHEHFPSVVFGPERDYSEYIIYQFRS